MLRMEENGYPLAWLALAWTLVAVAPAPGQEPVAGDCAACHDEVVAAARNGPHAVLDRQPALTARHGGVDASCQACHGDTAGHLASGDLAGLVTFGAGTTPQQRSAVCLTCHATDQPRFLRTAHAQVGLDCTSCHRVHTASGDARLLVPGPALARFDLDAASATCAGCHAQTLADFAFNERHRLQEGILGCADCHDPHAPEPRRALGGFKDQPCASCHADKSGPFVFEHGSLTVDGCVSCHQPHGAPSRHQLRYQSVAQLCYSCHVAVPGFHTRFTDETVCTNCHSSIHGSNFHPAFLQ